MSTPDYCKDANHQGRQLSAAGVLVCYECGKPAENLGVAPPNRAKMPPDEVKREIDRLRRLVNESLDRIQELTRAA